MYQKIKSNTNSSSTIIAGMINKIYQEDKDLEYHECVFLNSKIRWLLFENEYYEDDVKDFTNGNEETKGHYKSISSIPKYSIHKNKVKIGIMLPRISHSDDNRPFLFAPKTVITKMNKRRGLYPTKIGRDYFIYDVDEDYEIKENARLLFYQ